MASDSLEGLAKVLADSDDAWRRTVEAAVDVVREGLVTDGWVEVPEAYDFVGNDGPSRPGEYHLKPGMRVRHVNEQYPEARDHGTATVRHVMHKPKSAWAQKYGQPDIEVVVEFDKVKFNKIASNWAHYHCAPAHTQPEEA